MDKKVIKRNLPMFMILGAAGVIALGLLVYVVILILDWNAYWDRTDKARARIRTLLRQKPSPGAENEKRIRHDVEIYKKAAEGLRKQFKSPMQPALDEFFKVLQPPLITALSEEEKERYKEPGTGVEADPEAGTKAVPLKIRKFTQDEFVEFFRSRFDKYCEEYGKSEEAKLSLATLNEFMPRNMRLFPEGNWNEAVAAFARAVRTLTCEPVNNYTRVPMLLIALGLPRRTGDDLRAMQQYVDDVVAAIVRNASERKIDLGPQALVFVGGTTGNALPMKDYGMALFHWDVFGDIVTRLGNAKAKMLQQVVLRTSASGEEGVRGREGNLNLEGSFEQVGSFHVYHYTVVFTGTMESIRAALRAFDQANKDNRTYVVRCLCLYAREDGAAAIMDQGSPGALQNPEREELREEPQVRRRSRRGGRRPEPGPEIRDVRKDDEVQRQIAEREAALPPHQRSDYGMIRIGGEPECTAYLDIDYVVLQPNQ
ncbi:MAG: hypothetical protein MR051_01505 [Lentisphaeria bacterium]|nr:hypothetical protein [Lentisphaeria bacterium]